MLEGTQISLGDINDDYQAFVDKFKPKKTTDDCYTPAETYEAIKTWAVKRYGLKGAEIIRPFWPDGDYEREHYPEGCVVIDNPPFSILSRIIRHYQQNGIRFFLFAPYLTCLSILARHDVTVLVCDQEIVYENGARVNTSFITNLDGECMAASVPDLAAAIADAEERRLKEDKKTLPKYKYPPEVLTATMLGYMAKYGIEWRLPKGRGKFTRGLASQQAAGKNIFGGGLLLSEKAAAEKAAAEKAAAEKAAAILWSLSDAERALIKSLEGKS